MLPSEIDLGPLRGAPRTGNDLRWRVEHAQMVNPEDLNRFKELAVVPSVQSTHATSDMYWAEKRLGPERVRHAYAYKDLLATNGWIPNGSDFPIESINRSMDSTQQW